MNASATRVFAYSLLTVLLILGGQQLTVWQVNNAVIGNREYIDELANGTAGDRWTATMHREWCEEFKKLNPKIVLPEDRR